MSDTKQIGDGTQRDPHAQNETQRQGLDGLTIEKQSTAAMVQAERAKAIAQARIVQAVTRPRDFFVVRDRVMDACKRPTFAASAMYAKPLGAGKFAKGLSVRFAEETVRSMGNMTVEQTIVYEDARVRTIRVEALDLETNASSGVEITVEKTVERRAAKEGQNVIATRTNSYGDRVYIVEASEDEFAVKAAAQLSKARRNVVLQLVPGDLLEEARATIEETMSKGDGKKTPTERRKDLIDWFADQHGITAAQLADYLGHALDAATPDEMKHLKQIGNAIYAKEITWAQVLEASKSGGTDGDGVVATPDADKRTKAAAAVAEKISRPRGVKAEQQKPPASTQAAPAGATTSTPAATTQTAPAASSAPKVDPGAGLAEASHIIDNAEAATTHDEIADLRAMLDGAIEAGRIGSTHASRAKSAIDEAEKRLG